MCALVLGCGTEHPPALDASVALDGPDVDGLDAGVGVDAAVLTRGTDVVATSLDLDLSTLRGTAVIEVVPPPDGLVTLEVGDLTVQTVTRDGSPVPWASVLDVLDVDLAPTTGPAHLEIAYGFSAHTAFDGYMPQAGLTFLFPESCGNLFPCRSDPSDGSTFRMAVRGVPAGQVAVYPTEIGVEIPAYALAFAHGAFTETIVGTTAAGTVLKEWHLPGLEEEAAQGTVHLVAAFAFYEERLGPYPFGPVAGPLSAAWGAEARGGMEHHPFWHVAQAAYADPVTHVHEAAHGWFGDGVRLACWEDFVLSEGTATYLEVRALEVLDPALAQTVWTGIETSLDARLAEGRDTAAWPEGCGRIDLRNHPVLSSLPYAKGALFLRAVRDLVGDDALEAALGAFYRARVGTAASMGDLIATIRSETAIDPAVLDALVEGWLRGLGRPS